MLQDDLKAVKCDYIKHKKGWTQPLDAVIGCKWITLMYRAER